MAKEIVFKNGRKKVLLNPSEKGARYSKQLKDNCVHETGKVLSAQERGFRQGYLTHAREQADIWNKKNNPEKYELNKAARKAAREERKKRRKEFKADLIKERKMLEAEKKMLAEEKKKLALEKRNLKKNKIEKDSGYHDFLASFENMANEG